MAVEQINVKVMMFYRGVFRPEAGPADWSIRNIISFLGRRALYLPGVELCAFQLIGTARVVSLTG